MNEIVELLKTWEILATRWEQLANDLEQNCRYWREKCEFYETLIKGEVV
jgi:hypothetical protein